MVAKQDMDTLSFMIGNSYEKKIIILKFST